MQRQRIVESGKITFAVVGLCGWAGHLAGAHLPLALFSVALFGAAWYGIYCMTEVSE